LAFARVGEISIYYERRGQGPSLLLLHGIGSSSGSWRHQLEELSKCWTVLAWDAPGYGRSSDPVPEVMEIRLYAECVRALLVEEQLESVYLVGHSWGGIIAQEFYRAFPSYVRALILGDTNQGGGAEPREIRRRQLEQRLKMIQDLAPSELAEQRAPALLSSEAPEEVLREAVEIMSQVRPPGYRSAAISMSRADERDLLSQIQVPTLLVWGELDSVTPLKEGKAMQEAIAGVRLEVISGVGHLCYLERPQEFNEILNRFLEEVEESQ
jgi:pimeloyl-ACP methyl ester carboxylesterase